MTDYVECLVAETMQASGSIVGNIIYPPLLVDTGTASETVFHGFVALFVSTGTMSATISDYFYDLLVDTGTMSAVAFTQVDAKDLLTSRGTMSATTFSTLSDLFVSEGEMSASIIEGGITSLLVDTGTMSSTILPGLTLVDLLTSRGVMSATIFQGFSDLVISTGTMSATILPGATLTDLLVDTGTMSAALTDLRTVTDFVATFGTMSASCFGVLDAINLLVSESIMSATTIDALPVPAWTAPTDSFAMSHYTTLSLNSIALVGADVVAAGATGGFRRGGAPQDDGVDITASLVTGLLDFSNDQLKRPNSAYVLYKTSGAVQLRLGATRAVERSNGVEQSWAYTLPERSYTEVTGGRFTLGKGIESRVFRFTFSNIAGSSVGLRGVQFTYLPMARKF